MASSIAAMITSGLMFLSRLIWSICCRSWFAISFRPTSGTPLRAARGQSCPPGSPPPSRLPLRASPGRGRPRPPAGGRSTAGARPRARSSRAAPGGPGNDGNRLLHGAGDRGPAKCIPRCRRNDGILSVQDGRDFFGDRLQVVEPYAALAIDGQPHHGSTWRPLDLHIHEFESPTRDHALGHLPDDRLVPPCQSCCLPKKKSGASPLRCNHPELEI